MIGVVQLGLEHLKISTDVNETKGDGNMSYFRLKRDNGQPSTDIHTASAIHFKKATRCEKGELDCKSGTANRFQGKTEKRKTTKYKKEGQCSDSFFYLY